MTVNHTISFVKSSDTWDSADAAYYDLWTQIDLYDQSSVIQTALDDRSSNYTETRSLDSAGQFNWTIAWNTDSDMLDWSAAIDGPDSDVVIGLTTDGWTVTDAVS